MSFETFVAKVDERTKYDPKIPEDKRKILEFEEMVGDQRLEDYCLSRALIVKNEVYPLGAVVPFYIKEYKETRMLWSGLHELKYYRERARARELEQSRSLETAPLIAQMRMQ